MTWQRDGFESKIMDPHFSCVCVRKPPVYVVTGPHVVTTATPRMYVADIQTKIRSHHFANNSVDIPSFRSDLKNKLQTGLSNIYLFIYLSQVISSSQYWTLLSHKTDFSDIVQPSYRSSNILILVLHITQPCITCQLYYYFY